MGLDYLVFFASGTWTVPAGIYLVRFRVVGGGSGNGAVAGSHTTYYYGGAGGGFSMKTIATTPGTVYTITVGAAGASGGNGGTSSVAGVCSATGGVRTSGSSATGGSGSGGDINTSGGNSNSSSSGSGTQHGNCPDNTVAPAGSIITIYSSMGKFPFDQYITDYTAGVGIPGFGGTDSTSPSFGGGAVAAKNRTGGAGIVIVEW